MKIKRKKRNKINKKEVDFTMPITIDKFGTDEDPCFGKHYSPKAKECGVCGDCEICMIIQAQTQKVLRSKVESEGSFKDLEETRVPMEELHKYIVKMIKKEYDKSIRFNLLCAKVKKKFDPNSLLSKKDIRTSIKETLKKKGGFKFIKIDNVKFIKLKK